MTSKIFKSILSAAIAVLLVSLLIITGVLYGYFGKVQREQLKDELNLAANAVERSGKDYLESLPDDRYRLTWIEPDGTVIFDNHADTEDMENHADREEIKEALNTGYGSSSRYSLTLTQKTMYESVMLTDGSVLRISVSSFTVGALMFEMLQPILIIAVLAIALSAWIAGRMAKRIIGPLNKLDLEHPLENNTYDELSPLLRRIHLQRCQIDRQMQSLRQSRDEFNQITDNMQEGLVLLDDNGKIVSINHAAKTLFGVEEYCVGADFLTLERRHDMRSAIAETADKGSSRFHERHNGREYQFDLSRIESDGRVYGTVILTFDITEQVDAEKNRREFTANPMN